MFGLRCKGVRDGLEADRKGQASLCGFEHGKISFGDDTPRAIWYIGSEASGSRTWLWGYKNINRLDERLLILARDVRDFDLRHGLAELGTPKLTLSAEINGHAPSAIACGLSQEPAIYYRCPHAGGAVFVAFEAGECVAPDGTSEVVWTQASSSLWRGIT